MSSEVITIEVLKTETKGNDNGFFYNFRILEKTKRVGEKTRHNFYRAKYRNHQTGNNSSPKYMTVEIENALKQFLKDRNIGVKE